MIKIQNSLKHLKIKNSNLFRISIFEFRASNQSGFTLIEILLYIGIVVLLLFSVGISAQLFLESRVKNQAIADVNHQGANAMNMILQATRNADGINAPLTGATTNQLDLDMPNTTQTTSFRLSGGEIQIQEDGVNWIELTDANKVTISLIGSDTGIFSNLSRTGTPGIIRARFNVAYKQPAGVNRYFQDYDKDFQGAAALR